MPRIDDVTTRALAEVRYMPLSYYLETAKPAAITKEQALNHRLPEASPGTAPADHWERLALLLTATAIPQKQAA